MRVEFRGLKDRNARSVVSLLGFLALIGFLVLPVAAPDTGLIVSHAPGSTIAESPTAPAVVQGAPELESAEFPGYVSAAPLQSAASGAVAIRHERQGATPVTSTADHPLCGAKFTLVEADGAPGFCVHTALDPMPIGGPPAQAAAAAPTCVGNGVNGPRVRMIYMYVEGQPNRSAQTIPQITQIVGRMDGVFRETSKLQGREIGMRTYMPDCKVVVDTLMIDEDNGQPDVPDAMLGRVASHLAANGYDKSDTKYIVWLDGGNKGACGIAPAYTPLIEQGLNPTPATLSNIGWQNRTLYENGAGRFNETALIFRYGVPTLGTIPGQPECWGQGGTGARTEIHELLHNIGAVNLTAPNSNGFGHCVDDHDIMCYGEQGVLTTPRCATVIEQLDCGADDYFNVRPNAGSYLSTHWNTANSKFLGDAVVDNVPVELPRP